MPNWIEITNDNRTQVLGWVLKANPGISVAFKRPNRRSREQNDKMWPLLRAISQNVEWADRKFNEHQWKEIFMGSLWGAMSVPGIQGGVCFVGSKHSSDLTKPEMSELLESIVAFAAEHGIDADDY